MSSAIEAVVSELATDKLLKGEMMWMRLVPICLTLWLHGCAAAPSSPLIVQGSSFVYVNEHIVASKRISSGEKTNVESDLMLRGHIIAKGKGVTLVFREFSSNGTSLDVGGFQKITIWLPQDEIAEGRIELNSSVIGFWSTSGINPPGRIGCLGYLSNGFVDVRKLSAAGATLRVHLEFANVMTIGPRDGCEKITINREFTAEFKDPTQLSFWEGKPGGELYEYSQPK
jgi:hypothetical protein